MRGQEQRLASADQCAPEVRPSLRHHPNHRHSPALRRRQQAIPMFEAIASTTHQVRARADDSDVADDPPQHPPTILSNDQ